jgi:hypothetical protein
MQTPEQPHFMRDDHVRVCIESSSDNAVPAPRVPHEDTKGFKVIKNESVLAGCVKSTEEVTARFNNCTVLPSESHCSS